MKSIKILMATWLLLSTYLSHADIKNLITEHVKIAGSCAQCQEGIQAAAFEKNISMASWDKETQVAAVTFDSKRTSLNAILKKVALAGYDNKSYLAPDDAYSRLEECCRYERIGKNEVVAQKKMSGHEHGAASMETAARVVSTESDPLKPVLDAYYAVKDALVSSDGNAASLKASSLVKAMKAVDMGKLATGQHNVWMKVMAGLESDASDMAKTKDVAIQRDHFSSLSENMYKLIKSAKPSQTVYYQHCPMAKEGKGANWLSQVSAIKNPYYGAQMLNCGQTTETLK